MAGSEQNNSTKGREATGRTAPGEGHRGGNFTAPLGSLRSGRLVFASGISWVTVRADPLMAELYHAHFEGWTPHVSAKDGTVTMRYPRFPLFDWLYYLRERPAEVVLNAQVPWDIEIQDGVSRLTADLRGLELCLFEANGGASGLSINHTTTTDSRPLHELG